MLILFNTTGNKAYTSVWTMEGKKLFGLTDTTEMGYIPEKISKLTPKDKEKFHSVFYSEWVLKQSNHPLKGSFHGKKFGL